MVPGRAHGFFAASEGAGGGVNVHTAVGVFHGDPPECGGQMALQNGVAERHRCADDNCRWGWVQVSVSVALRWGFHLATSYLETT